ncbi:hypothetical protein C5167_047480 [Papaver somniferum]|uniref:Neprosin activation peptide domain-containing protein n=1 Tax=Papaver somniferum TaxID=3469 RepID=A0A4Y7LJB0_PAPSO|nr:uncharacterized protein LOC113321336 [Papaver somniferum]RZC84700.1 hypothetical protein C5167_047480 [Papaver somniferum]
MSKISVLCLLVLLLLFYSYASSGNGAEGFVHDNGAMNPASLHEGNGMKVEKIFATRKLLAEPYHAVLDYDYAGPNPKHEPRKGKPGGGW